MSKRIYRLCAKACIIFCLVIFTSQCFAQSSSVSAKEAADSSLKYLRIIGSVYNFAQQNFVDEVDARRLYEGAMKGMLEALGDPYTVYFNTEEMKQFNETTMGSFGGVGLSITKRESSTADVLPYVYVISALENTPGARAGILPGDYIKEVDGVSTAELSLQEATDKMRGQVGTSVELTVLRNKNIEFKKKLVRALIEVASVKYDMIGSFGYLHILQFSPETARRVEEAIDFFKQHNFTGLVIDLRNDGGGFMTSAIEIADKFIDSGPIVSTKSRFEFENSVYNAHVDKTTFPRGIPIAILINKGTASASEILAGALKDNHLAYLIGENSYGKGSVQQFIPLSENDGIKLTIARYYSPSDANIDKIGIPPDREVLFPVLSDEEGKIFSDLMKSDAIKDYVDVHPDMTERDITAYAVELQRQYKLDLRTLRRLVRLNATFLKGGFVYDTDYDVQLNAAVDMLKNEDFQMLMKSTRTLKELEASRQPADDGTKS